MSIGIKVSGTREMCQNLLKLTQYFNCIHFAGGCPVGPVGGHFFGIQHTQDRYTTAFYQPFLSDWKNYEGWEAAEGVWTPERAHGIYKDIIANFEEPPMDPAIRQELAAFVARRKEEGGAPTDF